MAVGLARFSPATWMAPPNYSSFPVRVVFTASDAKMMARCDDGTHNFGYEQRAHGSGFSKQKMK
ncbi:hypothetical protein ACU4GD_07140 [Cupriavidus basilensis]